MLQETECSSIQVNADVAMSSIDVSRSSQWYSLMMSKTYVFPTPLIMWSPAIFTYPLHCLHSSNCPLSVFLSRYSLFHSSLFRFFCAFWISTYLAQYPLWFQSCLLLMLNLEQCLTAQLQNLQNSVACNLTLHVPCRVREAGLNVGLECGDRPEDGYRTNRAQKHNAQQGASASSYCSTVCRNFLKFCRCSVCVPFKLKGLLPEPACWHLLKFFLCLELACNDRRACSREHARSAWR